MSEQQKDTTIRQNVNGKPFDPFDELRAGRLPGTMPGTGRTLRAVRGKRWAVNGIPQSTICNLLILVRF